MGNGKLTKEEAWARLAEGIEPEGSWMAGSKLITWEEGIKLQGTDLIDVISKRFYGENFGPPVDDKSGEGRQQVFVKLAQEDGDFNWRLEAALSNFLQEDDQDDNFLCFIFDIMMLAEIDCWVSLNRWWKRNRQNLISNDLLAIAALGALAVCHPDEENISFWFKELRTAPTNWIPRIFMGIRRIGFSDAVAALPILFKRAEEANESPEALLYGLYQQSPKQTVEWLKSAVVSYNVLKKFMTDDEKTEIEK